MLYAVELQDRGAGAGNRTPLGAHPTDLQSAAPPRSFADKLITCSPYHTRDRVSSLSPTCCESNFPIARSVLAKSHKVFKVFVLEPNAAVGDDPTLIIAKRISQT